MADGQGQRFETGQEVLGKGKGQDAEAQLLKSILQEVNTGKSDKHGKAELTENEKRWHKLQETTKELHDKHLLPRDLMVAGVKDGRLLVVDNSKDPAKHKAYTLDEQGRVKDIYKVGKDAKGRTTYTLEDHTKTHSGKLEDHTKTHPGKLEDHAKTHPGKHEKDSKHSSAPEPTRVDVDEKGNIVNINKAGKVVEKLDGSKETYKAVEWGKDGHALTGREYPNGTKVQVNEIDPNLISKVTEKDGSTWTPVDREFKSYVHKDAHGKVLENAGKVTVDDKGVVHAENVKAAAAHASDVSRSGPPVTHSEVPGSQPSATHSDATVPPPGSTHSDVPVQKGDSVRPEDPGPLPTPVEIPELKKDNLVHERRPSAVDPKPQGIYPPDEI